MVENVNTLKLLESAMCNCDYSFDIFFRMAVIDEYLKGNNEIWLLYNKMQKIRCKKIAIIPKEMSEHKDAFISLINSFRAKGFDSKYPILVNKDCLIIDGAHRMACSLYFDIPLVTIIKKSDYNDYIPAKYSRDWFINNDLSDCVTYGNKQYSKVKVKMKCLDQKEF